MPSLTLATSTPQWPALLLSEVDATTQKLLQTPEVSANGFTEIDGQ